MDSDDRAGDDRTGGIQVIARAAAVMRLLGDHPEALSLSAIAGELGLARSTVQRIVQALEAEGFVQSAGPQGGFQLGTALPRLLYRGQNDIVSAVRPELEALGLRLQETVALCALSGTSVTTLDRYIAEQPLRVVFPLGTIPHPLEALAPGRAILSALPRDQARSHLASRLQGAALEAELDTLARLGPTGRAHEDDVLTPGITGLAVPLISVFGIHALSVILPSLRAEGHEAEIFAALASTRSRIEAKIGAAAG